MTPLEADLLSAGLITKPTKKPKKFEMTVSGLDLLVEGETLTIENCDGPVTHLTVQEAIKFSEAMRDAMAVMISNSRIDF